ncbi:MAG: TetR family transcriptional regulator [Actinomycetota bacterium]|nr:TetR family transcriptional regulator [Actinomycetota bacterium]
MSGSRGTTKAGIADAATRLFGQHGYAGTSVRDIASGAGVDPALVIRYFGSKEQLFLEVMRLETMHLDVHNPLEDGPVETLGVRFLEALLAADDGNRGAFLALLRASDDGQRGTALREAHEASFVAPLLARLDGPDAELRARLAASLVGGLLYSLWVVGDEALANADRGELIATYGALLQRLITP